MYLISEFSKITNLTVKTLRYYDKEALLIPYKRDEQTGYRYYNEDNFQRAQQISLLRELDFSIMEIKEVFATFQNQTDLIAFLEEKQFQVQKRIEQDQQLLSRIKETLNSRKPYYALFQISDIEECFSTPQLVISYKFIGHYQDVGNYIGLLYQAAGKYANGPTFSIYYDDSYQEEASIRICLPIKQAFTLKNKQLNLLTVPKQEILRLRHFGSYESLSDSYKRLFDYAKKQQYTLQFPSTEHYLKGPGKFLKGDPALYETDISIPFTRKT